MSYAPQPGTVPHRVINWMKKQPKGEQFAAAVIADELGIEKTSVGGCLAPSVKHGAIAKEVVDGIALYSLGDGVSIAIEDIETDEILEADEKIAAQRRAAAKKFEGLAKAMNPRASSLVLKQDPIAPKTFRCGEYSDGTFVLERSGKDRFVLEASEFDVLREFVERRMGAAA